MPNPSIWGPLLGILLVFTIVGPGIAGLSLLFTKRPTTRPFWIFTALCAVGAAWWLAGLVHPTRVYKELFGVPPAADVQDLDYEIDREADRGVLMFRFRASPTTVRDLVNARFMEPSVAPDTETLVPDDLDTADWWPPSWAAQAETYHGTATSMDYRFLEEWFFHDPARGEVRYVMVGRMEGRP